MRTSGIVGLASALLFTVSTTALRAHPGHGHTEGWSLLHWLGEPEHFIPLILAVGLLVGLIVGVRRRKREEPKISE